MKKDTFNTALALLMAVFIFATVLAAVQAYGIAKQKNVECGFANDGGGCYG